MFSFNDSMTEMINLLTKLCGQCHLPRVIFELLAVSVFLLLMLSVLRVVMDSAWTMSSHGPCQVMDHVKSWTMSSHGPCQVMDHVKSWTMSSHGPCQVMDHVKSWTMSSHGPCQVMDHVDSWTMSTHVLQLCKSA